MTENAAQSVGPAKLDKRRRFPHIQGVLEAYVHSIDHFIPQDQRDQTVTMEGTIKLDGTHADVAFDITQAEVAKLKTGAYNGSSSSETEPRFQSRNFEASSETNNHEFPRKLVRHVDGLKLLKIRLLRRHCQLHPDIPINPEQPLIIAGEWNRRRVKRGLGIDRLPYIFVILSVSLNGAWQRDADFADIEMPEIGVYNILRVPAFAVAFNLRDLHVENAAFKEMRRITNEVGAFDPFVHALGVPEDQCQGEGTVWKLGMPQGRSNPHLWLKMHAPEFYASRNQPSKPPKQEQQVDPDAVPKAKELAEQFVTKGRVDQGFDYLQELQLQQEKKNVKTFMDWVANDMMREEKLAIQESGLNAKLFKHEVLKTAREEYFRLLNGK